MYSQSPFRGRGSNLDLGSTNVFLTRPPLKHSSGLLSLTRLSVITGGLLLSSLKITGRLSILAPLKPSTFPSITTGCLSPLDPSKPSSITLSLITHLDPSKGSILLSQNAFPHLSLSLDFFP